MLSYSDWDEPFASPEDQVGTRYQVQIDILSADAESDNIGKYYASANFFTRTSNRQRSSIN